MSENVFDFLGVNKFNKIKLNESCRKFLAVKLETLISFFSELYRFRLETKDYPVNYIHNANVNFGQSITFFFDFVY